MTEALRQKHGELTYLRTVWASDRANTHRWRVAVLQCSCGAIVRMKLGKWRDDPSRACKQCALGRSTAQGRGVPPPWKRARYG